MSQPDVPDIYFIFPYRPVGGVSTLFLRLAEFLAENQLAKTWLVDYPDGFMARNRREGLANFLCYQDNAQINIPSNAVAIFQSITPWSIYPSLHLAPDTRVLFWNCYPFNLVPLLPGFRQQMMASPLLGRLVLRTLLAGYRRKMLRTIDTLLESRSLVFMDETNVRTTENYLGCDIGAPAYLPIPVSPPAAARSTNASERTTRSEIRAGWIGRIADFKYFILKRSLLELDRYQPDVGLPIHVTIVGTGEHRAALERDIQQLKHLQVNLIDFIPPDDIDQFLSVNIDLLLAMGTCALDGAKLGIPTILLDCAYEDVPDTYRFQWLHDRRGYTLGDLLGPEHLDNGSGSMKRLLNEFINDRQRLSSSAETYVKHNHDLAAIARRLSEHALAAECRWKTLVAAGVTGRGMIYTTFNRLRQQFNPA